MKLVLVCAIAVALAISACGDAGKDEAKATATATATPAPVVPVTEFSAPDFAGQTDGAKLCSAASALRAQKHYAAAYRALVRASALQGATCAHDALADVAAEYAGELCAQAKIVADSDKAAATALRKRALALGDHASCAHDAFATPKKTSRATTWETIKGWLDVGWPWALAGLLLLGAREIVLRVFDRRRRAGSRNWFTRPRLVITKFGSGGDTAAPEALAMVMQAQLHSGSGGFGVDLVTTHDAAAGVLDDVKELSDGFKVADAVIGLLIRLSPLMRLTLTGDTLPAGPRGAGVVLTLTENAKLANSAELWERAAFAPAPVDAADNPTRLAAPATAWLACAMTYSKPGKAGLPTGDPLSYACGAAGVEWLASGQSVQARHSLGEALDRDTKNWQARGNLALMFATEGHWSAAIGELERALDDYSEWIAK